MLWSHLLNSFYSFIKFSHQVNNSTILWSVIVSVVTGLKKELKHAISKDETGMILEWQSAIINHLYWVAASTPENVDWKDIVLSKWKSLCSHIVNVHKHPNQPYSKWMNVSIPGVNEEKRKKSTWNEVSIGHQLPKKTLKNIFPEGLTHFPIAYPKQQSCFKSSSVCVCRPTLWLWIKQ